MNFLSKQVACFFGVILLGSQWCAARVDLSWSEEFSLPPIRENVPNPGVARPFAGESCGWVLLAGGANFPDLPLADGCTKQYHSEIYGLDLSASNPVWRLVGNLPEPMAEGASVTTPRGIVCAGGQVGATLSDRAFLMNWDAAASSVRYGELPPIPEPLRMPALTARDTYVYLAGGTRNDGSVSPRVWRLDLAAAKPRWSPLPDLPEGTGQPVAVVQNLYGQRTALFVFGGMRGGGKQFAQTGGWRLTLAPEPENEWRSVPPIAVRENPDAANRTMIGASALAIGDQHILIFGGSDRRIWNNQVEQNATLKGNELKRFRDGYFRQPNEAFRFGTAVLVYHTVTERWFELGKQPFAGRCGAAVLRLADGRVFLGNGEVGPGIRTPCCSIGTFQHAARFHPVNAVIIFLYFAGMALMGFYFMRRNKNSDDYFRGGGRLPWWAVSISLYATMFSSITFLSIPAMSYLSDCRYLLISVGIVVLAPIVTRFYLPFFRKLNLTSAYEYLEVRFNLACRLFASAAFTLFMIARTAVVTYLPAIAISAIIRVDVNLAIIVVTVITILYCTIGGIEAVIWSDFIQSLILFLGTATIFIWLVTGTDGGFAGFLSIGNAAHKFRVIELVFDWSKPVFWVVLVGGLVANLASYTSDQCVVQRYMTTVDEAGARRSILFNGILSFFNCIVFFTLGVALYTFYFSHPDLLDVTMPKNDSIFPLFIGNDLPVGLSGVVLAAVAAATMSTLSSNLNSSATAVTTDFFARLVPKVTERGKMLCGRWVTVLTGLLGGGFALVLANQDIYSIYDQFQRFLGILTGGLGCLFFMGIFLKRVNGAGAIAGLIANYAVCICLDQFSFAGKPHVLLFGALGMIVCLVVAGLVSFFVNQGAKK